MAEPAPVAEDLSEWTAVLTPVRGWFDLRLREVWAYRDLIGLFFKRDFVASYKQTILGPFWFFAQPLMTSLVFWVVFGRVGKIVTKGVPQFLFFMAGIILWNFFPAACSRPPRPSRATRDFSAKSISPGSPCRSVSCSPNSSPSPPVSPLPGLLRGRLVVRCAGASQLAGDHSAPLARANGRARASVAVASSRR